MRFKIDENLPIEIAELLKAGAHDAVTVAEQGKQGSQDAQLAQLYKAEDRILVTLDIGFADIRSYPPQTSPGLMVLRLGSQDKDHILGVWRRTMPLIDRGSLAQHLWIVEETQVRIRGAEE